MSGEGIVIERSVHFEQTGRGGRRELRRGEGPKPPPPGRVPRVARLLALAVRMDALVCQGAVGNYAELARLGHVTRARVTQVMNLLCLAPDIQEQILFLPRIESGRDPIVLRDLQPIALTLGWPEQRRLWSCLLAERGV